MLYRDTDLSQAERRSLPGQQISLPTLLSVPENEAFATPTGNLTLFQDALPHSTDHMAMSLSVRTSQGSTVHPVEFSDYSELTELGPTIQRTLFTDDGLVEIQISRV